MTTKLAVAEADSASGWRTVMDALYFALAYKKEARCPVFLNGMIHEAFSDNGYDRSMQYTWHYAMGHAPLADLPPELWLIAKDRAYDFDFHTSFDGHVVSGDFLSLMQSTDTGSWQAARLHAVSTKGKRISVKDYFFVKFPRAELLKVEDVVDLERSKIDYRRDGQIKKVWELRFRKSPERDLFFLDCISLLGVAFCSERFTEGAKRFRPRGVEFVELPEIGAIHSA
ncbi:Imm43 family immunity protein [Streptomyces sp. NPDC048473]|uniref:Imm43 family immunity protein n=1 Tax=unclassified Streptomyces TaxID=2593676 RepID=UPI0037185201